MIFKTFVTSMWMLGLGAALLACSSSTDSSSSDSSSEDEDGDTPEPISPDAPVTAETLVPWLEDGNYLSWIAEPNYHESSGPHGDAVKVFYSPSALSGIEANETDLRPGGAVVKELTSGGSLYGWGVYVRTSESPTAQSIYYYELIKPDTVYGDAYGSTECTGCHSGTAVILSDVSLVLDL